MTERISNHVWDTSATLPGSRPRADKGAIVRGRPRRAPLTLAAVEGAILCLVMALLIVLAGTVIAEYVTRPDHPPVISVTVAPGDTLWGFAGAYGSPNDYILQRVERLAAYNHIAPGEKLKPGQVLLVPVENPAMLKP